VKRIVSEDPKTEKRDLIIAYLINEKLRKKAPKGWDSTKIIKIWRSRL